MQCTSCKATLIIGIFNALQLLRCSLVLNPLCFPLLVAKLYVYRRFRVPFYPFALFLWFSLLCIFPGFALRLQKIQSSLRGIVGRF